MVSKSEFWKNHVAGWQSSGQTQRAYCYQHALSLPSSGYWRRVSSRRRLAPLSLALVPIVVGEPESIIEATKVRLPDGVQVQLPLDITVARWLPMLQALLTC